MKARLMYRDLDFEPGQAEPFGGKDLAEDLGLGVILKTMAGDDAVILQTARAALLSSLVRKEDIVYRQAVLRDALQNPQVVRGMYSLVVETLAEKRKNHWWYGSGYLSSTFSGAVELLYMLTKMLEKLRGIADHQAHGFESEGFLTLFQLLKKELSDAWLEEVFAHLEELKGYGGMLIGARLGDSCQGIGYVFLHREKRHFMRKWWLAPSFTIAPRDDSGAKDLENRRERAISQCADVLVQATDHILGFFERLRVELSFYVGCLNLADRLRAIGAPLCTPGFCGAGRERDYQGLYDMGLALVQGMAPVGNELNAKEKELYLITGANQGGKSTYLRSIGQAQLLAQCGMFVPAKRFMGPIASGVFTHFKREEDKRLESGKLDEELGRMSLIVDHLKPGALVLLNESFAATNEREGSEIARQITKALVDSGMEVFSVTHLYEYAQSFLEAGGPRVQFLLAQRLEGGKRTFRILPGQRLQTGFGEDLYQKIFSEPSHSENLRSIG